ncbi:MAG: hypothetical protein AAGI23_11090 [Bacteroidota bacterium]
MKYYLLFGFLCCALLTQAQSTITSVQVDERLYEVYDEDYLTRILEERPFLIKRWNFQLDYAYYLTGSEKALAQDHPTIAVKDITAINIIALMREHQLLPHPQLEKSYRIANTNQVLVLRSSRAVTSALNEHLGRQYPKK